MNKTFTFDDLILLAYNEKNQPEKDELLNLISSDEETFDEYISILEVQSDLDKLNSDPADDIIQNLMNYSKSLEVFRVRPAVDTVLIVRN